MAERAFNEYQSGSGQAARNDTTTHGEPMVEQAKHVAEEVKQEASEMFRSQADKGSSQAGEKVLSTAQDLHSVSDSLREQGRDSAAKLVEQGAYQAERLANYMRDNDADIIMRDVQDYARRQPWLVALGGLALGLFAARMVKAARETSYTSEHGSRTYREGEYGARHLTPVPASSAFGHEDEPGHQSGSAYRTGYESGSLEGSSSERPESEDDYRTGQTGTSGRPF